MLALALLAQVGISSDLSIDTNVSSCLLIAHSPADDAKVRVEIYNACKNATVYLKLNKDGYVDAAECMEPGQILATVNFCTDKDGQAVLYHRAAP